MIAYDKSLYSRQAIERAIEDYREIAHIFLTENKEEYLCEFREAQGEIELIQNEFSNYVLNLTIMMGGTEN